MTKPTKRSVRARKKFTLVLRSNLVYVPKVERFLLKVNRLLHLDEVQFNKLFVATSEAVNNGILHGNNRNPNKKITVTCEVDTKSVIVRVRDEGKGFDFKHLLNPVKKENLLLENGRGIFVMRTLMDKVEYSITPEGAEVVMKLNVKRET